MKEATVWIEGVNIECSRCYAKVPFFTSFCVNDLIMPLSVGRVFYEIKEANVRFMFDAFMEKYLGRSKYGANCKEGYIDFEDHTFTCKSCLMKMRAKKKRAKTKRRSHAKNKTDK